MQIAISEQLRAAERERVLAHVGIDV